MTYEFLDQATDAQLIEDVKAEGDRYDAQHPARIAAFAERYGEAALALYPILESLCASAHGDCISAEASVETDDMPRCWAVPENELNRLQRCLGLEI